jgi:hypothetical protein
MDELRVANKVFNESYLRSFFTKGCIRLSGTAALTDLKGFGILVAADATFDNSFDGGDNGITEGPAEAEVWSAGFYWPGKVKNVGLTGGTIYIGRL